MKVRDLMTPNPQTVRPTDPLSVVAEKMRCGRFRRVPVVDDAGNLIGIITDGDLREHAGYLPATKVRAVMVERPVTISPEATIGAAAELMRWHKIGGLPVVDAGGHLVGIVTESDLLLALVETMASAPRGNREANPAQAEGRK